MMLALEDALLARIRTLYGLKSTQNTPYKISTIESWGGQVALDDMGRATAMMSFALPAVFVALGGLKLKQVQGERIGRYELPVVVYVAAYSNRNERAQRAGDQHSPGTFQMAEDLMQLLGNQRLGMDIQPLRCTRLEPIFSAQRNDAKAISMMALHLESSVVLKADLPDGTVLAEQLLQINDGFYLPQGDAPGLESTPRLAAQNTLPTA